MSLCWPRRLLQYDNSEAERLGGGGEGGRGALTSMLRVGP